MPDYVYRACDTHGKITEGRDNAESTQLVEERIRRQSLFPISIQEYGKQSNSPTVEEYLSRMFKVPKAQLIFFYDQLASLIESGMSIHEALQTLEEQVSNKRLMFALRDIREKVEGGTPFHAALEDHKNIFGIMAVRVVDSGEKTGKLELCIAHLAEMLEFEQEVISKFRDATRYPKFVVGAIIIASGILLTVVLPNFMQLFQRAGVELPWMTQLLFIAQTILMNGWGFILLGGIFCYTLFQMASRDATIIIAFEKLKLKIPFWGDLELKIEMSRIFKMLAVMLESGVDILTSLDMASKISRHHLVANAFLDVKKQLEEGDSITNALKNVYLFPKMSRRMIMLGDRSGQLGETLEKISEIYEKQTSEHLKKLSNYIEPLLIVSIGVIIVIFAMGIFLPMWDLIKVLR